MNRSSITKSMLGILIVTTSFSCNSSKFDSGSNATDDPETPNKETPPSKPDDPKCQTLEADSSKNKSANGEIGSNLFFKSIAVDPLNTGSDPSSNYGYTPYKLSPPETLNKTTFEFAKNDFKSFLNGSITKIEWLVFAHQFGSGLDTIDINLTTIDGVKDSKLSPNIYSAYGIATIENIKPSAEGYVGDVHLSTFGYDPNSDEPHNVVIRGLGNASGQVGSQFVGPASEHIAADVVSRGINLDEFKLTITIDADSYDSVQYRTIEAYAWGETAIASCE